MSRGFSLRMARRELRASGRRLGLFVASVAVGVAAIVAVSGFKANVLASLEDQGRVLLGADLELESRFALPDALEAKLDSVVAAGGLRARVTSVPTMVASERTGRSALLTMRAVDPAYPFYGEVETEPAGAWQRLTEAGTALVDAPALARLGIAVGDTVRAGARSFAIVGVVRGVSGDPGIRSAVNPRLYVPEVDLQATELIQPGSIVVYRSYLKLDGRDDVRAFVRRHASELRSGGVTWDTARERERDFARAFDALGRFLGLAGLAALLLGGVGVASAVNVWMREHRRSAAILRCLGTSGAGVVRIYLYQAAALGLAGSAAGAALGVGLQAFLPRLLADLLPLDPTFTPAPGAVALGVAAGMGTAGLFAWRALLPIRRVRALGALREAALGEAEGGERGGRLAVRLTDATLVAAVVGLAIWQAGAPGPGLAFAGGTAATLGLLRLAASGLIRVTRRAAPAGAPFAVRQGIANLFRPGNQTRAAVLALGFAVFVVGTTRVVERNVRASLTLEGSGSRANVAVADIPPSATGDVLDLLARSGGEAVDVAPIIPMRLHAVRGRTVVEWLAAAGPERRGGSAAAGGAAEAGGRPVADHDGAADDGPVATGAAVGEVGAERSRAPRRWALSREYRASARDTLLGAERVVAGAWWGRAPPAEGLPVSLERDLAGALGVGVGDTLVWDVQGRLAASPIASLREVDWGRLEPNFLVLFPTEAAAELPRTDFLMAAIASEAARAEFQDRVARRLPGALVLDFAAIRATLARVLDRATAGARFMGGFTIVAGLLILAATVVASRGARRRENALLRALGADAGTLRGILLTEFLLLGGLAGLAGAGCAALGGWAVTSGIFELPFALPVADLAALWGAATLLSVVLGTLGSRAVLRPSAMAAIRHAEAVG